MRVMRGSMMAACKSLAALFTCMVRSLKQLKVLPLYPVRFCLKKMGPRESSLMSKAKMGINHERMSNTIRKEKKMSILRLANK